MSKPSTDPKEYRDQMARECYEQLLENKTTICRFAKENNIHRNTLWGWINSRYFKPKSGTMSPSFVKIEKAPVNVVIDYYGARIQTDHNNLACVLSAIKAAHAI